MTTTSRLSLLLRRIRRRLRPSHYKEHYIQTFLDTLEGGVYLEIGVRLGDSFRYIKAQEKIGVDPCRTKPMSILRENESFFEMTSDAFFKGPAITLFEDKRVDVCLIDGLHTFRQSLADVLNSARYLQPDGVIVLDDVFPDTADKASPVPHGRAWNGDVWKTMALLRSSQPDWEVFSLPVDEGVGLIRPHGHAALQMSEETITSLEALPYKALESNPNLIGLQR